MSQNATQYCSVWLPVPKRQTFSYLIPDSWRTLPKTGQLVWAPLGRRKVAGMIESVGVEPPLYIKDIKELIEPFPEDFSVGSKLLALLRWAIEHYLAVPGEVLRSFFPAALLKGKIDKGERARQRPAGQFFTETASLQLNSLQEKAVSEVISHLGKFSPFLLHGITGSGKTEVYLRLCEAVLRRGQGVLILVPEISLTPQTVGRFAARFGDKVGSYHSGMSEVQRLQTWWQVKDGVQRVVVGTRSAACLPVQDLGLIVVDEEHDSSYKQEERFRYHGRDLAVVRAKLEGVPVLLGSATPSLESWQNVQREKYHLLKLPERATAGRLPKIQIIDLKSCPPHPETLLSEPLADCLKTRIERGEQALLFLNRRGFAPFLLCRDCGEVPRCPNCDIGLNFHKRPSALKCHYCDLSLPPLEQCPACKGFRLEPIGAGTERVEAELKRQFPKMRLSRLDRDTTGSRARTEEILSQFGSGEIDVLIGTQLVTKGHDFKRLTLVGILLADVTLNLPDFRAAERVFQLITQVSGRAGRHELEGEVFLQTYRPEHFAITSAMAHDHEQFFVHEISHREELGYPPFGRLVLLRLTGTKPDRVEVACRKFAADLQTLFHKFSTVGILGPSKSTLEKLRG